ncbi:MAG: MarC family protein [Ignavibacteria bacterium]|nr:MarC family protein [Ignavibacteria bacterium]
MNFETFLLAFIPMFVAFDALGIIPMYLGLTETINREEKKKLTLQASFAALIICLAFLFIGNAIFNFLGITVNDFRIAGGLILLIISINDLLFYSSRVRDIKPSDVGIVPLGIPLIAGPGVLTTIMISNNAYGFSYTVTSLVINILLTFLALYYADFATKVLGQAGSKAFAKVASLFLAAIAIMMIRVGLMESFFNK